MKIPMLVICALVFGFQAEAEGTERNPLLKKPNPARKRLRRPKLGIRADRRNWEKSKTSTGHDTATLGKSFTRNKQVLSDIAQEDLRRGTEELVTQDNTPEITNDKTSLSEEQNHAQFDIPEIKGSTSDTPDGRVTASRRPSKKTQIRKEKPTRTSGERIKHSSNQELDTDRKPAKPSKGTGRKQNQIKENETTKKPASKKTPKPETLGTRKVTESTGKRTSQKRKDKAVRNDFNDVKTEKDRIAQNKGRTATDTKKVVQRHGNKQNNRAGEDTASAKQTNLAKKSVKKSPSQTFSQQNKQRLPKSLQKTATEEKQPLTNLKEKLGKGNKARAPKAQEVTKIDYDSENDPVEQPNRKNKVTKRKQPGPNRPTYDQVIEEQVVSLGEEELLGEITGKLTSGNDAVIQGDKQMLVNSKGKHPKEEKQQLAPTKEENAKKKKLRAPKAQKGKEIDFDSENDPVEQPSRKTKVTKGKQPVTKRKEHHAKKLIVAPIDNERLTDENTEFQPIVDAIKELDTLPEMEAGELPNLEQIAAMEDHPMLTFGKDGAMEEDKQLLINNKEKLPKEENQKLTNTKGRNTKKNPARAPKVQKSEKIEFNTQNDHVKQPNRKKKVTKEKKPFLENKEDFVEEQLIKNGKKKLADSITENQFVFGEIKELGPLSETEACELPNFEKIDALEDGPIPAFGTEQVGKKEKKVPANSKKKLPMEIKERQPKEQQTNEVSELAKKEATEKPKRKKKAIKSEKPRLPNNTAQVTKEERQNVAKSKKPTEEKPGSQCGKKDINRALKQPARKPLANVKACGKDHLCTKATNATGSDKKIISPPKIVLQDSSQLQADAKMQGKPVKSSNEEALGKVKESEPPEEKNGTPDSITGSYVSKPPNTVPDLTLTRESNVNHPRSKVLDASDIRKAILENFARKSPHEKISVKLPEPTDTAQNVIPRTSANLLTNLPHVQKPDTPSSPVSPNLEKVFEDLARLLDTFLKTSQNQPDPNKFQEGSLDNPPTHDVTKETANTPEEKSNNAAETTARKSDQDALDSEAVEVTKQYKLAKELPFFKMKRDVPNSHDQGRDTRFVEGTQALNPEEKDPLAKAAVSNTKEMLQETSNVNTNVQLRKAIRSRQRKINN